MGIVAALLIGTASVGIANPQMVPREPVASTTEDTAHSAPLPPSREVTSSIGLMTTPALNARHTLGTSSLPTPERKVLILLLGLCFVVMAFGGYGLWRRSLEDLVQAKEPRHNHPGPGKRNKN
ncbi:hypothetical protein ASE36_10750 [Rhizobium sp. Root274]|nr:hypothetical protein ASC71_10765 [Rhizobium sp. Root1240]KRD29148.1 hypothetical protein ASE36_10750 [Rhizobium sp. Root274]